VPEYEGGGLDQFVTFGGRSEPQVKSDPAAWLRAVARLWIDQDLWHYQIYEAMGGRAYIALLAFKGSDDHVFEEQRHVG
jgi:hypothetical protein